MVRTFILSPDQRKAINEYLKNRSAAMSYQIRQIRLRAKRINFEEMIEDITLVKKLAALKVPKGRKARSLPSGFMVVQKQKHRSKYDPILDQFMEGDEDRVEVTVEGKEARYLRIQLNKRIGKRGLKGIKALIRQDGCYLEKVDVVQKTLGEKGK